MTKAMRELVATGRVALPGFGEVRERSAGLIGWVVVDGAATEIEPISVFLRDLSLSDMSPLTTRSYGYDLLRWWRLLALVEVDWEHTSRAEIELLVGWMRLARNAQRDRGDDSATIAGSVNLRTGNAASPIPRWNIPSRGAAGNGAYEDSLAFTRPAFPEGFEGVDDGQILKPVGCRVDPAVLGGVAGWGVPH